MKPEGRGFLLLSSKLGDPDRKPLSTAQLRCLAKSAPYLPMDDADADVTLAHLLASGVEKRLAVRALTLLEDELQLDAYLTRAANAGCVPLSRSDPDFPQVLRHRLGLDAPGCLWAKGDLSLLLRPAVALVGSRVLREENRKFARQVGIQAARQGYVLISGNARGADSAAQAACLEAGGNVICIVADSLAEHPQTPGVLYLSEEDFDEDFSIPRALHRNRIIHAMGCATFAAQCTLERGGTWDGSTQNLRHQWSPLYIFRDGSAGAQALEQMGAFSVGYSEIGDFSALPRGQLSFFE